MSEVLTVIAQLSGLVFVVASMLSMGLSLTIQQIREPLRSGRLVIFALLANFVFVPALAYGITAVISVGEAEQIGIILLATAAGAPFLPKLAQAAKGSQALSVGLMVLLMVVTVAYVPIVLPLLMSGVEVNPLDIASSLIITMLIPLGIGLFIKSRYADSAAHLQPTFGQASNVSLILLSGIMLVLNIRNIIDLIGTGAILAAILLIVGAFAIGYLFGGSSETRSVVGLGTGQRNISAAIVVAATNFSDPDVLVMLIVAATVGLFILMPLAGEIGRRSQRAAESQRP